MQVSTILVVTGASGAGKTAAVQALASRNIPGVRCFHLDSIGVPSAEEMERDHGDAERWQASATAEWLHRLGLVSGDVRVAVLDAQTRPSTVFAAADGGKSRVNVVLFDCAPDVREERLRGPRGQPDLVSPRMDAWAAYLRGQADALGLVVIDTTASTVADAADQLEAIVVRLANTHA